MRFPAPAVTLMLGIHRRGRDSNPRCKFDPTQRFSKPSPSATRPPLHRVPSPPPPTTRQDTTVEPRPSQELNGYPLTDADGRDGSGPFRPVPRGLSVDVGLTVGKAAHEERSHNGSIAGLTRPAKAEENPACLIGLRWPSRPSWRVEEGLGTRGSNPLHLSLVQLFTPGRSQVNRPGRNRGISGGPSGCCQEMIAIRSGAWAFGDLLTDQYPDDIVYVRLGTCDRFVPWRPCNHLPIRLKTGLPTSAPACSVDRRNRTLSTKPTRSEGPITSQRMSNSPHRTGMHIRTEWKG